MHASIATFLDDSDSTARVMAHGRLLLKLSRRFEAVAPAGLAPAARVANFKSGKIVIHADNGAVATKIRQMSQRLCDELSKGGPECNVMEVKVQPRQFPSQSISSTPKPLSGRACRTLEDTAAILPRGNLRSALEHLLERAAKQE
ncbi:MAG TPA: DUF721 domain-containing protein [Rhodocyclaceae bacterium]|nr:DUF721 domain-containing protein [Rhodocyclaceae bacterium]